MKIYLPMRTKIVRALRDASANVREAACKAVAVLGPGVMTANLVSTLTSLLRDDFYQVRHSACVALGRLGEHACVALPELIRAFQRAHVNRADASTGMYMCVCVCVYLLILCGMCAHTQINMGG